MSMSQPIEPSLPHREDGVPAADPGTGAPQPAEGFGVGGEEPDVAPVGQDATQATPSRDTPFRTPDPDCTGPDRRR